MVDDKAPPQPSHQAQSPADLKRNALHLSVATGSVDAVAKILSTTKLDINATDSPNPDASEYNFQVGTN
ncbi:hypothetical protein M8J77_000739 [Diaphorina citri]|nr:hypothetical protein M8J77_000739 [Diaphorina citri]